MFGNLRQVDLPDGREISYVIDARGRRVERKVDGVLTSRWVYRDNLRPLAEFNAANQLVTRYVYAEKSNVPSIMMRGTTGYRIISDVRGSVRLVVNVANGDVVQRMDYDEFGRVLTDTNPGFQPFGFAGGLYDADTGLVRFGARDYDAYSGRWTARDPILFAGGQANLYAYVGNDPIGAIDPNGLATWTNNSSVPIDVVDENWNWLRLEPGQGADIDGFFNRMQTPFENTTPDDIYRKVGNMTDGTFEDGPFNQLSENITSGGWFDAIYWSGWKDAKWVREKHVPKKAICE